MIHDGAVLLVCFVIVLYGTWHTRFHENSFFFPSHYFFLISYDIDDWLALT